MAGDKKKTRRKMERMRRVNLIYVCSCIIVVVIIVGVVIAVLLNSGVF